MNNPPLLYQSQHRPVISNGLIGFWNFSEGTGSIAHDFSGNNIDATITGSIQPAWKVGKVNASLYFSGSAVAAGTGIGGRLLTKLDSKTDIAAGGAMTVCWWMYRNQISNDYETIMDKRILAGTSYEFGIVNGNTGGGKNPYFWSGGALNPGSTLIPLNTWTHVAITVSGAVGRYYVDGVAAGTTPYGVTTPRPTSPLSIGCVNYNTGQMYIGWLDEMYMFNRALSLSEIIVIRDAT
jgi:hypothetical protein